MKYLCQFSLEVKLTPFQIVYNLRNTLNSCLTDTPIFRTQTKSPTENTKKLLNVAPAVTDSSYYGITDTLCAPNRT